MCRYILASACAAISIVLWAVTVVKFKKDGNNNWKKWVALSVFMIVCAFGPVANFKDIKALPWFAPFSASFIVVYIIDPLAFPLVLLWGFKRLRG